MPVKVSVVVPVHNGGPGMDPCVGSLLSQSLSPAELELLFVNDGSTDDTLERLEEYAARHPQLKVLSIPASGWPGKPRNVGTDAAVGEYVMYVDHDDRLEPEALQRMYELGSANGADVVLGKVISDFRGVHHPLYRTSRPHCTVYTAPLINSLTPHKMLRTEFLRAHGIRYPEGPRRLEDQLFMTKAYFAASGASIVGDYICYRYLRQADGHNIGSKRIVPREYYANLAEVLDVVDAYTEPGEVRDGFYRRFLRTEMLGRLDSPNLLTAPAPDPTTLLTEIRDLMTRRFPITVDLGLGTAFRCRAALTREGTVDEVAAQAGSIRRIQLEASVEAVEPGQGALQIAIEGRLLHDGAPLKLDRDTEGGWLLPTGITDPIVSPGHRRVEDAALMPGDVVIKHRQLGDEWYLPSLIEARVESDGAAGEVVFRGTASVDPQRAAGGRPLRHGLHDLNVRVVVFGLTKTRRVSARRLADLAPPVLVDDRQHITRLYATAHGQLSASVKAPAKWLSQALASATFVETSVDKVVLDLGVLWTAPPRAVILRVFPANRPSVRWVLRPADHPSTRWHAAMSLKHLGLPSGRHRARLKVVQGSGADPVAVTLEAPFEVTTQMRRAWLLASLRHLPGRTMRYLHRRRHRTDHSRQ